MFFDRAKSRAGNSFSSDELATLKKIHEEILDELDTNELKLRNIAHKMAPERGANLSLVQSLVMIMSQRSSKPTPTELIALAELIQVPVNTVVLRSLIDAVGYVCGCIKRALEPSPSDEVVAILINNLVYFNKAETISEFNKVLADCLSSFTGEHQTLAKRYIDKTEKLYHRAVDLYKVILNRVVRSDIAAVPAPAASVG